MVKAEAQDLEKLHSTYPHSLKQVGPIEPVIMQKPTRTEIVREAAVKDPVIKPLEGYINTRQTQNEYIGWGRSLTGTSKTVKLEAAKALLDYLNKPDKTKQFQPTQEQYNALIEPFSKLKDIADKILREIERNDKLTIIAQPEKRGIGGIKEKWSRLKQTVGAALENKLKGPSNHK